MVHNSGYELNILQYNPLHDHRQVDVDAWSQVWFDELAQLDSNDATYLDAERALATQFGLHPAIRTGDADDLGFFMELLRLVGGTNPYVASPNSLSERYQYDHWEQMRRLGQLVGRQVVRKTLEDAEEYVMLRIEQENAGTDYLTGVRNRRGLARRLEDVCGISSDPVRRGDTGEALGPVAIAHVYADGNRFGSINKYLGHHVGDAALVEIAWAIQDLFRRSETLAVYRHGGDEFGVVLEGLSEHDVALLIGRITTQQTEKALDDQYRQAMQAIVERVRVVKESGERVRIDTNQRILSQDEVRAGQRPYHTIYINGVAVTELRNIITLALGAKSALVSSLSDVEESRRGAEIAMRGAKRVFHSIMGEDPLSHVEQDG
jgi:diguanylate cyclase (GGDEF)-like protein